MGFSLKGYGYYRLYMRSFDHGSCGMSELGAVRVSACQAFWAVRVWDLDWRVELSSDHGPRNMSKQACKNLKWLFL